MFLSYCSSLCLAENTYHTSNICPKISNFHTSQIIFCDVQMDAEDRQVATSAVRPRQPPVAVQSWCGQHQHRNYSKWVDLWWKYRAILGRSGSFFYGVVPLYISNIPYGQSSAKFPVTLSLDHSITRSLGHLVTLSLSHLVTQFNMLTDEQTHNIRISRSALQTKTTSFLFTIRQHLHDDIFQI